MKMPQVKNPYTNILYHRELTEEYYENMLNMVGGRIDRNLVRGTFVGRYCRTISCLS